MLKIDILDRGSLWFQFGGEAPIMHLTPISATVFHFVPFFKRFVCNSILFHFVQFSKRMVLFVYDCALFCYIFQKDCSLLYDFTLFVPFFKSTDTFLHNCTILNMYNCIPFCSIFQNVAVIILCNCTGLIINALGLNMCNAIHFPDP